MLDWKRPVEHAHAIKIANSSLASGHAFCKQANPSQQRLVSLSVCYLTLRSRDLRDRKIVPKPLWLIASSEVFMWQIPILETFLQPQQLIVFGRASEGLQVAICSVLAASWNLRIKCGLLLTCCCYSFCCGKLCGIWIQLWLELRNLAKCNKLELSLISGIGPLCVASSICELISEQQTLSWAEWTSLAVVDHERATLFNRFIWAHSKLWLLCEGICALNCVICLLIRWLKQQPSQHAKSVRYTTKIAGSSDGQQLDRWPTWLGRLLLLSYNVGTVRMAQREIGAI